MFDVQSLNFPSCSLQKHQICYLTRAQVMGEIDVKQCSKSGLKTIGSRSQNPLFKKTLECMGHISTFFSKALNRYCRKKPSGNGQKGQYLDLCTSSELNNIVFGGNIRADNQVTTWQYKLIITGTTLITCTYPYSCT